MIYLTSIEYDVFSFLQCCWTYCILSANDRMNLCQFNDEEDDCRYYFTYEYVMNNQIVVKVQGTKGEYKTIADTISRMNML